MANKKFSLEEVPPKVLKIFRAVISLMEKGEDIYVLTVADITKKAGIGKGTAYEYFETKEEIILSAMQYCFEQNLNHIQEELQNKENFRDMVFVVFDWIQTHTKRIRAGIRIWEKGGHSFQVSNRFCNPCEMAQSKLGRIQIMLDDLLKQGEKEKIMSGKGNQECRKIALISNMAGYFLYCCQGEEQQERDRIKEFLYQSILKSLNHAEVLDK